MKDFLGNELHIGDEVVFVGPYQNKSLHLGKIIKLETNKFKKEYVIIESDVYMKVKKLNTNVVKINLQEGGNREWEKQHRKN